MITIVGLGPGSPGNLTLSAWQELENPGRTVWLRTNKHPVGELLSQKGITVHSFDAAYEQSANFSDVYFHIAKELVKQAQTGKSIVYAVPGHPCVAEESVKVLRNLAIEQGVPVHVIPGMSSIEAVYGELELDPSAGLTIVDALAEELRVDPRLPLLITQVYSRFVASDLKLHLLEIYPPEHEVVVVTEAGTAQCKVRKQKLYELDHVEYSYADMLFLPALVDNLLAGARLEKLQSIMSELRAEGGCPWDQEQTHESLRPYLIEETYEVLEAIDKKDKHKLAEELGDLLLQIIFHCQIAAENGDFTLTAPIQAISEKMIRRHPHVFGSVDVANSKEVLHNWQLIKAGERGEAEGSYLDSVTQGLPSLMEAAKTQAKAREVGFDWPSISGALEKVYEELRELTDAQEVGDQEAVAEEFGDLLFAVVNVSRFLGVEPENCLRLATAKFRNRFVEIERLAKERSIDMKVAGLTELDKLWCEAKLKK